MINKPGERNVSFIEDNYRGNNIIVVMPLYVGQKLRRRVGSGTQRIRIREIVKIKLTENNFHITREGSHRIYFDKLYYGCEESDGWVEHKSPVSLFALQRPVRTRYI